MWGEQVSQDAVLSSLTPRFVNKDYVTAEITYSTAQVRHEVLTRSWVLWVCLNSTHKAVGMTTLSWLWPLGQRERREYSVSTVAAAASARREYCCGCCASQERGCVLLGYAMAVARRE